MEAGYCLSLGGGVLNNCSSSNDLDIVAVSRKSRALKLHRDRLVDVFLMAGLRESVVAEVYHGRDIFTFSDSSRIVQLVIVSL